MSGGRPAIPRQIRRQVVAEAGGSCGWCGRDGAYDIHHILGFSETRRHVAEELIPLCPDCHRLEQRGRLTLEELLQRKQELARGTRGDRAPGHLKVPDGPLVFNLGSNVVEDCENILVADGQPLLSAIRGDRRLLLSMRLYDLFGTKLVARVIDNNWWVDREGDWDFNASSASLAIFNRRAGPLLTLSAIGGVIYVFGHLFCGDWIVEIGPTAIVVGRWSGGTSLVMTHSEIRRRMNGIVLGPDGLTVG